MRFFKSAVVIGHEVHRAFVEFRQKQAGNLCQAGFGVAHGGRAVTVTAAEVALPQHERIAHVEVLRHANHRVIGGSVTMGVEFTEHVTHHTGAFHRFGFRAIKPHFMHRIKNAALHGFLSVTDRRQRAALHNRHRVFQIRVACKVRKRQTLPVIAREHRTGFQGQRRGRRFFCRFIFNDLGRFFTLNLRRHFFCLGLSFLIIRRHLKFFFNGRIFCQLNGCRFFLFFALRFCFFFQRDFFVELIAEKIGREQIFSMFSSHVRSP